MSNALQAKLNLPQRAPLCPILVIVICRTKLLLRVGRAGTM